MQATLKEKVAIDVISNPILLSDWLGKLDAPEFGAQIWFSGIVRDHNLGKKVVAVSYDAFLPLAKKTLSEIAFEALEKWGQELRLILVHRVGYLKVGELSVLVGVASPHREEAYQTSRYLIENLKHRAPIWKKEHYHDGETEWLPGHSLCGANH